MTMKDGALGKKVSALVEEQLQYCRALRQADMLSVTQQTVATDEECLKQANSMMALLKADVRALNACAARLLLPTEADGAPESAAGSSDVASSAYSVETIERVFRRMRPVDTSDSSSGGGIKALSATNQLVGLRQRLNAGLSARLLEMKAEMDKEFGTAFVDMESYLRTERDIHGKADSEHCSACARSFIELCYKFQVMVHACRGLRAAKEGLNQAVLLKALGEERDTLAKSLGNAETELKRIHHSYTEMMTPEVAVGLQNRQRHKIEEQEADIGRLKGEIASLRRDHQRLLAENGRSSDATEELQTHLRSHKEQYARELAWLNPKVITAENRALEIEGLVDQMNLRLSLLGSSHRKTLKEVEVLKGQLSMARADGVGAQLAGLQEEASKYHTDMKQLQSENARKERLTKVAMSARAEAITAYRDLKSQGADLERRLRETQGARVLGEAQLEDLKRRQGVTEQSLAAAEGRELQTAENLAKALDDLSIKTQENEILQERLDSQEMELRDFSNLKKEFKTLAMTKKDLVYRLATVNGLLESLKQKAIGLGMGRELGLG